MYIYNKGEIEKNMYSKSNSILLIEDKQFKLMICVITRTLMNCKKSYLEIHR